MNWPNILNNTGVVAAQNNQGKLYKVSYRSTRMTIEVYIYGTRHTLRYRLNPQDLHIGQSNCHDHQPRLEAPLQYIPENNMISELYETKSTVAQHIKSIIT